jgi:hypothetical protein
MVAANPLRVGTFFSEKNLHHVVDCIDKQTGCLLQVHLTMLQAACTCLRCSQVVNYNVKSLQYVVAGHIVALEVLKFTLTHLKSNPKDIRSMIGSVVYVCVQFTLDHIAVDGIISKYTEQVQAEFIAIKATKGVRTFII